MLWKKKVLASTINTTGRKKKKNWIEGQLNIVGCCNEKRHRINESTSTQRRLQGLVRVTTLRRGRVWGVRDKRNRRSWHDKPVNRVEGVTRVPRRWTCMTGKTIRDSTYLFQRISIFGNSSNTSLPLLFTFVYWTS